jgi:glycosyltransferase involved in cell wall biosynthesis
MRILVVQETDWVNSLPLQSHHIMEHLASRGHEVTIIDYEARWRSQEDCQHFTSRTFPAINRTGSGSPVRLIKPGMIKAPGVARLTSAPGQFRSIFEQMARHCDVVVLYSVPTNGLQTLVFSRILGRPVLFHSFDVLHRMTGHQSLVAPTWAFERFVYRRVDKIVVISSALRDYMKSIGVRENNIVLLPPAVDTNRFHPSVSGDRFRKSIGLNINDTVVLFSGWLYEFSGLDTVIRSFMDLMDEVPQLKLVVCGDGPQLDELQRLRNSLELKDQVKILGRLPFEEMPRVIASADLCINPYIPDVRSNHAFPSKIAEYMAEGKPVLATDLPGTRSLLPPQSGVELVPPSQFIDRMREMIVSEDQRSDSGRAARKYCEANFSIESVGDRFEQTLESLIRR